MASMVFWGLLVCVLIMATSVVAQEGPLTGHKVIRILTQTKEDVTLLRKILAQKDNLDVWKEPSCPTCGADVRLSPLEYDTITSILHKNGFRIIILIHDVQKLMDSQRHEMDIMDLSSSFSYSKYHRIDEIYGWMTDMGNTYTDLVTVFNATKSYEGRPLMGLKISSPTNTTNATKHGFWIQGGIHAREWISPATVIFMAGQMLENYKKDPELTSMVDMFDWYILPVTNPDGYSYTWINPRTRLWRKTRSWQGYCRGVDPNRNWNIHWCKMGASRYSCANTYCGSRPFSEVETRGVATYLSKINNLNGFIDFHSYSQLWMSSWGYTRRLPKDYTLKDKGSAAAVKAASKLYGTNYRHGSIANTLYLATGSMTDWVYDKLGVKYSYVVELPDRGRYGFFLPESQIEPTGRETLEGLKALAKYIYEN